MGDAESTDWLLRIALNPDEPFEVRRTALYATGIIGNGGPNGAARDVVSVRRCGGARPSDKKPSVPVATLVKLYDTISDRPTREQLLYTYARRSDNEPEAMEKLIQVAKNGDDTSLRQRAVFWLSQSKSQRAAQALAEIVAQ